MSSRATALRLVQEGFASGLAVRSFLDAVACAFETMTEDEADTRVVVGNQYRRADGPI